MNHTAEFYLQGIPQEWKVQSEERKDKKKETSKENMLKYSSDKPHKFYQGECFTVMPADG